MSRPPWVHIGCHWGHSLAQQIFGNFQKSQVLLGYHCILFMWALHCSSALFGGGGFITLGWCFFSWTRPRLGRIVQGVGFVLETPPQPESSPRHSLPWFCSVTSQVAILPLLLFMRQPYTLGVGGCQCLLGPTWHLLPKRGPKVAIDRESTSHAGCLWLYFFLLRKKLMAKAVNISKKRSYICSFS